MCASRYVYGSNTVHLYIEWSYFYGGFYGIDQFLDFLSLFKENLMMLTANIWQFSKELSLSQKLCFSKPYIFGFQCRRPWIYQTKNSVRSSNVSLKVKYERFATLGSKDIGIINLEFVAKTQFLSRFSIY